MTLSCLSLSPRRLPDARDSASHLRLWTRRDFHLYIIFHDNYRNKRYAENAVGQSVNSVQQNRTRESMNIKDSSLVWVTDTMFLFLTA